MTYTVSDILTKLDLVFKGVHTDDYPKGNKEDIKYNFFLDLEHGYCETAASRIHLYADKNRWAIVFEKSGYQNRGDRAEIELNYVGNCIDYHVITYPERSYITNSNNIVLITSDEYERVRNKEGSDMEQFELISPTASEITIHGQKVRIDHDNKKFADLKLPTRDFDNPKKLLSYGDIIRFFADTNPSVTNATEEEIRQHIPKDIPKILSLDNFHFESIYKKNINPSEQETYQLIAKVLANQDTTLWRPKLKPNNHWSNWESGNL
jgi:ribosomal protein S15P/S13E